jgi:hypothetical protein
MLDQKDIVAKTCILVVQRLKRETEAKWLKDVKVGDELIMIVPFRPMGRGRGCYAQPIIAYNLSQSTKNTYTFNQLSKVFEVLELEIL